MPSKDGATDGSKAPAANTTLFVSRLPFTATSVDLETLFSDVGPLRRAFIVSDHETKRSKGVGYVTYTSREDAERALETLQGHAIDDGKGKRKLLLAWADEKPSLKERKGRRAGEGEDGEAAAPPAKRPRVSAASASAATGAPSSAGPAKDPDAVRTVILSGLAACTPAANDKTIYKRARKIGDVERVTYPAVDPASPHPRPTPSQDIAYVVFRTPNHAATAVEKLHAHTFKGAMLSVVLKKRADGAARLDARMKPETREKHAKQTEKIRLQAEEEAKAAGRPLNVVETKGNINRGSRLIIRNLPFDVTAADLRAVFLPYGPIYNIDVPQKAAPPTRSEIRKAKREADSDSESEEEEEAGEAEDAEMEDIQEEEEEESDEEKEGGSDSSDNEESEADEAAVPAAPATASASSSSTRGRGFAFVWHISRADAQRAIEGVNGTAIRHGAAERAALKAANGKKGREAAKAALVKVEEHAQPERVVAVDYALDKKEWEKRAEETDGEESAKEDAPVGGEDDDDDEDSHSDSGTDPLAVSDAEEEEEPAKPALPQPEEGTTLFIRNLPYQATELELRDVFRNFGTLRYARITMDKATQRSKGTGFVCFWSRDSADAALRQARLVESEAGASTRAPAAAGSKNPFTLPSVLTADASAPLTASLSLHGRVLSVVPAVARETAGALEANARSAREKGDKRNTHLMREGVPFPNSPLSAAMSEAERDKRLASFGVRKAQLGANPSLFISKTRLSIRSLPLFATDRILKRLAIHAVKTFGIEARAGQRPDLTPDEKADRTMSDGALHRKPGERQTAVVQSKVVRQQDRVDALTGNGRSRGYGFLEMRSFAEALKVVRWANARAECGTLMQGWWVEELEAIHKRLTLNREKMEGEERTEADARVKRIAKRLEELKAGAKIEKSERGGLVQIEFSIENATVTKKRRERTEAQRDGARKRQERAAEDGETGAPATGASTSKPDACGGRDDKRSGPTSGRERDKRRSRAAEDDEADKPKKHANWNKKSKKDDGYAGVVAKKAQAKASVAIDEAKGKRAGDTVAGSAIGRARKKKAARRGA